MALLPQFAPPANQTDFTKPTQAGGWSKLVSGFFDQAVKRTKTFPEVKESQFYNATKVDTPATASDAVILWPGFPKKILSKFPGDKVSAYKAAEDLSSGFRLQDEYLEWHATRNAAGKLTRVVFTCESPEYWEFLAKTDPATLLKLYKDLTGVSTIKKADLIVSGKYKRLNRFNVTDGAVHLTHPANTLSAEIFIAADATVKRKDSAGDLVTDADELIECANFGEAGRASDPHIGDEVNKAARGNFALTIKDPVGLYILAIHDDDWKLPDGSSAKGKLFKIRRGSDGMALSIVFEAPAGSSFVLGDAKIGAQPIDFAGRIAERIDVGLTGRVFKKNFTNDAAACEGGAILAASPEELAGTRVAKV